MSCAGIGTRRARVVLTCVFAPAVIAGCSLVAGVDFDAAEVAPPEAGTRDSGERANDASLAPSDAGRDDAAIGVAPADADSDASDAAPPDPCDLDGDGYRSASPSCGGTDCDDDDLRAHPDAGFVTDFASAPRFGDWDCDGLLDKRYRTNATCTGPAEVGCLSRSGFTGDPDCGVTAPWIRCTVTGNVCDVSLSTTRTQGCR